MHFSTSFHCCQQRWQNYLTARLISVSWCGCPQLVIQGPSKRTSGNGKQGLQKISNDFVSYKCFFKRYVRNLSNSGSFVIESVRLCVCVHGSRIGVGAPSHIQRWKWREWKRGPHPLFPFHSPSHSRPPPPPPPLSLSPQAKEEGEEREAFVSSAKWRFPPPLPPVRKGSEFRQSDI